MKKWDYNNHDEFNVNETDLFMDLQLSPDIPLADDFTDRVMERVRRTEINPLSGVTLSEVSGMLRHNRRRKIVSWVSTAAAAAGIAASLFFIGKFGAVTEPVAPASSQQRFLLPDQWAELDLLDAKALGVVQQPNIQVSDKGYTLYLQEVVADPTRMVLNLRITDQAGEASDVAMSLFDGSQLEIRNKDGRNIGQLKSVNPVPGITSASEYKQESVMLTYIFPDEQPENSVFIEGNVHKLISDSKQSQGLDGDWSFSYKADMTVAQQLAKTTDLNESYTAPNGRIIEMERITHTPAGVKLEFTTASALEAVSQTPSELKNDLNIMFHFEGENGEELTRINSYKDGGYLDTSFGYTVKPTATPGKLYWTYYFKKLPYDTQQIRFVFDGYIAPVGSNDSVTFRPLELEHQPAVFKAQGDVLYVNHMEITEIKEEPGLSGWMKISGKFSNRFNKDKWIALDGHGNVYNVKFRGALTLGESVTFGETDKFANEAYFIAEGMTELPEEVTLTRTLTENVFRDVDWSFDLPPVEAENP